LESTCKSWKTELAARHEATLREEIQCLKNQKIDRIYWIRSL